MATACGRNHFQNRRFLELAEAEQAKQHESLRQAMLAGQGETELAAVVGLLQEAGWSVPGREFDDGDALLGHRIFADGYGAGSVLGFSRATVGVSSHLIRLDNGENVEVRLERKGNKQVRWLLAPRANNVLDAGSSSAGVLAVLTAPPKPLPSLPPEATTSISCHYCDVSAATEVAGALLTQLTVCVEAQSRLLSKQPQPAAVRSELETFLLTNTTADPTTSVAESVETLCDTFARKKATFGGRFSSSEGRKKQAQVLPSKDKERCSVAWPFGDRIAMAGWLHFVHDQTRQHSCWQTWPDSASRVEHQKCCRFRPILCPNDGCTVVVSHHQSAAHDSACEHKLLLCTQGCGRQICRSAMESHCNSDCGERLIPCPYWDIGCQTRHKQHEMEAHEVQACAKHMSLVRESQVAQFGLVDALAQENSELRAELQALKSEVAENNERHRAELAAQMAQFSRLQRVELAKHMEKAHEQAKKENAKNAAELKAKHAANIKDTQSELKNMQTEFFGQLEAMEARLVAAEEG